MAKEKKRGGLDLPDKKNKKRTMRKNHLLVIGIDGYANGVSELNNAVLDAKAFRDLLWEQYQFEKENTICLFDKDATTDNILETLKSYAVDLTDQDNLLIYFSGHGELNKITSKGYWLPVDSIANREGSYLSNNDIIDYVKVMKAHHIFAIIDSCFSGALFHRSATTVADEKQDRDKSRWLLTAGRNELVSDGPKGSHSPFAYALLNYLKNNDQDSFWVSELCLRVLKGVQFNASQSPRGEALPNVGHLGGQFVFYPKGYVPKKQAASKVKEAAGKRGGSTAPPKAPASPPVVETKEHFTDLDELKLELKLKLAEDISDFFTQFDKVINPSSRKFNDSILQKGAYKRAKKDEDGGLASKEFINRTYARIRNALTNMADDLKETDLKAGVLV